MGPRLLIAATAVFLLTAPTARGDVKRVRLSVQGATCPKCGFAPAKGLTRLPGVAKAALTVKPQHMDVWLEPGAWVDPARMLHVIRRSNLKSVPSDVRLTVTGMVEQRGDGLVVVLDKMQTPVALVLRGGISSPEVTRELQQGIGSTVSVEGLWQPAPPGQPGAGSLGVTHFGTAGDGQSVR